MTQEMTLGEMTLGEITDKLVETTAKRATLVERVRIMEAIDEEKFPGLWQAIKHIINPKV